MFLFVWMSVVCLLLGPATGACRAAGTCVRSDSDGGCGFGCSSGCTVAGHLSPEAPVLLFTLLLHHLLHLRVRAAVIAIIGGTPFVAWATDQLAVATGIIPFIVVGRGTDKPVTAPPPTVGARARGTVLTLGGATDLVTLQTDVTGDAATGQHTDVAGTVTGLCVGAGGTGNTGVPMCLVFCCYCRSGHLSELSSLFGEQ